jgi:hypothetical protein
MTWPTKTNFIDGDVLTAAQVNNIGTNLNLFDPTSATANQVPLANGSGSVAWGTLSSTPWELITTTTSNTTGVTVSGSFDNYRVVMVTGLVSTSSNQRLWVQINADTNGSNYKWGGTYNNNTYSWLNVSSGIPTNAATALAGNHNFCVLIYAGQDTANASEINFHSVGKGQDGSYGANGNAWNYGGSYIGPYTTWSSLRFDMANRTYTRIEVWGQKQ